MVLLPPACSFFRNVQAVVSLLILRQRQRAVSLRRVFLRWVLSSLSLALICLGPPSKRGHVHCFFAVKVKRVIHVQGGVEVGALVFLMFARLCLCAAAAIAISALGARSGLVVLPGPFQRCSNHSTGMRDRQQQPPPHWARGIRDLCWGLIHLGRGLRCLFGSRLFGASPSFLGPLGAVAHLSLYIAWFRTSLQHLIAVIKSRLLLCLLLSFSQSRFWVLRACVFRGRCR